MKATILICSLVPRPIDAMSITDMAWMTEILHYPTPFDQRSSSCYRVRGAVRHIVMDMVSMRRKRKADD